MDELGMSSMVVYVGGAEGLGGGTSAEENNIDSKNIKVHIWRFT
jgi:hypothetical protein